MQIIATTFVTKHVFVAINKQLAVFIDFHLTNVKFLTLFFLQVSHWVAKQLYLNDSKDCFLKFLYFKDVSILILLC